MLYEIADKCPVHRAWHDTNVVSEKHEVEARQIRSTLGSANSVEQLRIFEIFFLTTLIDHRQILDICCNMDDFIGDLYMPLFKSTVH